MAASASFDLSCGPTDLTKVELSGPCSTGDASPSNYLDGPTGRYLAVGSPSPGKCHVVMTFANGFTYSTDVTFTLTTDGEGSRCGCSPYVAPTQARFRIDNPAATCIPTSH